MIVAIAALDQDDIGQLRQHLSDEYEVLVLEPTDDVETLREKCDIVLLDAAFTPQNGLDFLISVVTMTQLPVVMLTPANNQACAVQALQSGAFNYLMKTGEHLSLVPLAIADALKRSNEREETKRTIAELEKRIANLQARLPPDTPEPTASHASGRRQRSSILDEIATRLRRGEINLPVYPQINIQFREMLRTQAPFSEIAALLGQDVSMTSKLLAVANSSYYGGRKEVTTLKDALGRLGLVAAKNYVEMLTNRSLYTTSNPTFRPLLEELWSHSRASAHAAYGLAVGLKMENPDDLFTMAILHDIGKLFLLQVVTELKEGNVLEQDLLPDDLCGFLQSNHVRFGAALLKRWNLSDEIVQVARYHEDPAEADPISKSLCVVSVANLLVQEMGYGQPGMPLNDSFALKLLGISQQVLDQVAEEVSHLMTKVPAASGA